MRYVGGVDEQENPIEISDPRYLLFRRLYKVVPKGKRASSIAGD